MATSTIIRRRLGAELRERRIRAGLSQEEAADRLEMSRRTIMRAEAGASAPAIRDLRRMLDLYGADPDTKDRLLEAGRQARQRSGGWWVGYRDILPGPWVQLEAEASDVRNYEAAVLPGLLQTERYMRAIGVRPTVHPDEMERRIEARMHRQRRVDDGSLKLRATIDEAVLRRGPVDNEVMSEQLRRLLEVAELPNVTVRVLPFSAGIRPGSGYPVSILTFPSPLDPPVALVEAVTGERYADDAEEVAMLQTLYEDLESSASSPEESSLVINEVILELTP